jgi:hypothetical protein
MPTTTDNQNPTTDRNGKDRDPPKNPIRCIWRNLRRTSQKKSNLATTLSAENTRKSKKENAPTALVTNDVSPSLQKMSSVSQLVRIKSFERLSGTDVLSYGPTTRQ